jgi:hypothetical protein
LVRFTQTAEEGTVTSTRSSTVRCWPFLFILAARAFAADAPDEAKGVLAEFRKGADAIQAKADAERDALALRYVPRLKAMQDKYCRAAKLDEALAVRDALRSLLGILPDPGVVQGQPTDIGRTMLFQVTGSVEGSVWGTGTYTTDSQLSAAAVHAGAVQPGQTAVVRVHIVPGLGHYTGSTANQVTSAAWEAWPVAFTVERVKSLPGLDAPP